MSGLMFSACHVGLPVARLSQTNFLRLSLAPGIQAPSSKVAQQKITPTALIVLGKVFSAPKGGERRGV